MKRFVSVLLAALLAGSLSACGLSSGNSVPFSVGPGSIRMDPSLKDVPVTVGSKDFTEQILLAYITEYALQAAGMDVKDLSNISGSNSGRQALLDGQIDVMWEYTGTAWISYLSKTDPISDPDKMFAAVRDVDAGNGVSWVDRAPLNNVYTMAQSQQVRKKYGVRTLSDLAALFRKDPSAVTICIESEFASRNDGWPSVEKKYGFKLPDSNIRKLDTGAIYQATANAQSCNFGEIFQTDARQRSLNLSTLKDDKHAFPAYNGAVTLRTEFLKQHPAIERVLAPVAAKLTSNTMIELSTQVDVRGRDSAEVAREWMIAQGFVSDPAKSR
ncbi:glycine betaine ABC transporter substrate-binding protein [Sciscionella marina]|uniref:glycine betaine ABC transporter substrate-binding protein n=1 Tax=Sciscionella marina TaxID=508770 RepID=UPI000364C957|nr:glycine betaine ABC transporter substrate-binding protein [Sciscionella marina]